MRNDIFLRGRYHISMLKIRQFLLLIMIIPIPAHGEENIQPDKIAHFSASAISTVTLLRLGETFSDKNKITLANRMTSSLIVAAAGFAKEVDDCRRRGDRKIDMADLRANSIGIVFGNLVLIEF